MGVASLFTLADLADQVCLNLGAQDNITQLKARKYVNRTILRFIEMGTWSFQHVYQQPFPGVAPSNVTVANQISYVMPNVLKVHTLYMRTPVQRRLQRLEDRKYRRMYPNDTAVGTPYYYREMGRATGTQDNLQIGLYPIPDAAYTLYWDGIVAIPLLVNDTDDFRLVCGIPGYFADIIIEMATAIGWKEVDDQDQGAQLQEVLMRLKSIYEEDQNSIEDRLIMAPFESEDVDRYFDPMLDPRFGE